MQKVTSISGTAAALLRSNIDTDAIVRIDRLMLHGRGELGPYCLEAMRLGPDGAEREDFVLNTPRHRNAQILIAGDNFGCGSSREAAVWALFDYGIRCIISRAFGDIFYSNCLQNGLLPVVLSQDDVQGMVDDLNSSPVATMTVDLTKNRIISATGRILPFSIDEEQRRALLEGTDQIDKTLTLEPVITQHEAEERLRQPWVFDPSQRAIPRVLILAGDGIGPEVMTQVRRIADWFAGQRDVPFELREEIYGVASWNQYGAVVRDQAWEAIKEADAILFGATGSPDYETIPREYWIPDNLLRIRKELGLFANLRPIQMHKALEDNSTLRPEVIRGADLLIVRELAGGAYFGTPRGIEQVHEGERRAVNTIVYTTSEIERIARIAFDMARVRDGRVCSVDKANVLEFGMLWREVVQAVRDIEFPDIELRHMYVDNAAMQLVREPTQFDVLLTENLFGDILSDCAAMVAGSIGMLPSASFGAATANGHRRALYEPIHGSAPDLQGKNIANPLGAILSFAMCLQYSLSKPQEAALLRRAVDIALAAGARTKDIAAGANGISTVAMGDAVLRALDQPANAAADNRKP